MKTQNKKYIASVSFGKDSLAMLLLLLKKQYPLDEVVFYDTGVEFDAIYKIIKKVKPILKQRNIVFTILTPKVPFLDMMLRHPIKSQKTGTYHYGYGWCGGACRWGTGEKLAALDEYCKGSYVYIGIASDDPARIIMKRDSNIIMPLVDWGMSEIDCLHYCFDKGFDWTENGIELYEILDRVSCWCYRNKNLKELKNYYLYLPKYWQKLKDLQDLIPVKFKQNYSIYELEEKFKKEVESNGICNKTN